MMLHRRMVLLGLLLVMVALPVRAQDDDTRRDTRALAERLLGFDADFAIPPPTPRYRPGDSEEFWVTKSADDRPSSITATLVAASPNLYVWVEDSLSFDPQAMVAVAQELDRAFTTLRLRGVYGEPTIIPNIGEIPDITSLIDLPDVDLDPHLFVLYASDLGNEAVVINPNDSLPMEIAPGDYSNQHELIAVNMSVLPGASVDDPAFTTLLAAGFYEFLAQSHTPDQAQWLREGLGILVTRLMQMPQVLGEATTAFLQDPNASLIRPSSVSGGLAVDGAQQMFFDYTRQRFGFEFFQSLFKQPGAGLQPFDRVFAEADIVDPVTGTVITGDMLFADFVVTNVVSTLFNRPFGDQRYWHFISQLPENVPIAGMPLNNQLNVSLADQVVNQYGTRYLYVLNDQQASFEFSFTGQPTAARLPLPADSDPDNHFYWSGDAPDRSAMLTQTFDLTNVDAATLQFDTWYQLDMERNYAYVQVSTDGGATWEIISSHLSSEANRYALAYGPGYTGFSNPEGPQPFPIVGIVIDSDGMTVTEVTANGPASHSDLQAGDVIIGYDGQRWPGQPNVIALLADYAPNDTLNFYVQRGDERLDIPVVLGEHPSRVKQPPPIWTTQEIDLSEYVGQEIQVRFEYVSQPGTVNAGLVIDNIAIPEIDFVDDAESASTDWDMHGWQQIDNQVQQKFLVQYITAGTENSPPRVRHLIGPDDDSTQGTWQFQIDPNEFIVFAISGMAAETAQPARFTVDFSSEV